MKGELKFKKCGILELGEKEGETEEFQVKELISELQSLDYDNKGIAKKSK